MIDELINVWMRNELANEQVLDECDVERHISEDCVKGVYSQFAHIHTIRYYNIEKQKKELVNGLIKLSARNTEDRSLVRSQLVLSAKVIAKMLGEKDDVKPAKRYQSGLIGWITYLINHESHHRSKAMMQMKAEGIKFSNRLKFDLWDWK